MQGILKEVELEFGKLSSPILITTQNENSGNDLRAYLSCENLLQDERKSSDVASAESSASSPHHSQFMTRRWENYARRSQKIRNVQSNLSTAPATTAPTSPIKTMSTNPGGRKRSRRTRGGSANGNASGLVTRSVTFPSSIEDLSPIVSSFTYVAFSFFAHLLHSSLDSSTTSNIILLESPLEDEEPINSTPLSLCNDVRFHALFRADEIGQDEQILESMQPQVVIIVDPSLSWIRTLELYKARHPSWPLRVYFLMFENSVEEQRYLTAIRQEKKAFERLIREKSVTVPSHSILTILHESTVLLLGHGSVSRARWKSHRSHFA